MQTDKKQLQRQQIILTHLGFYRHKCDGIWGPETISAKQRYEADPSFVPALPNNGLPFGEKEKYPKGIKMDKDRLLTFVDPSGKNSLTDEKIQQIAGSLLIGNKVTDMKEKELPVIAKEKNSPVIDKEKSSVDKEKLLAPIASAEDKEDKTKK